MKSPLAHRRDPVSMARFYDWFYRFYGGIEKTTSAIAGDVLAEFFGSKDGLSGKSALEYACGTGALSLKLAGLFGSVSARDSSVGMLSRAEERAREAKAKVDFRLGDMLDIRDAAKSFDWAFVSFALHLFSSRDEEMIISRLLRVAREGVFVIDHSRHWSPTTAFVEWIEGSHYDEYLRIDFEGLAHRAGAFGFKEYSRKDCSVFVFEPEKG